MSTYYDSDGGACVDSRNARSGVDCGQVSCTDEKDVRAREVPTNSPESTDTGVGAAAVDWIRTDSLCDDCDEYKFQFGPKGAPVCLNKPCSLKRMKAKHKEQRLTDVDRKFMLVQDD